MGERSARAVEGVGHGRQQARYPHARRSGREQRLAGLAGGQELRLGDLELLDALLLGPLSLGLPTLLVGWEEKFAGSSDVSVGALSC